MVVVVNPFPALDMPAKASPKTWRCPMRSFSPQAAVGSSSVWAV